MKSSLPILVIACGGKSERMGADKCFLNYHGQPQYKYLKELFEPSFSELYFSIRKEQELKFDFTESFIIDLEEYEGHGPISGLLSCFKLHPNCSILFIGCDYPLITVADILKLTENSSCENSAAYFDEFYEPLLALYNQNCAEQLQAEFNSGNFSLQKFLNKISAKKIKTDNNKRIKSIDTVDDFNELISEIHKSSENKFSS